MSRQAQWQDAGAWVDAIARGDRRALARAITLVESGRSQDRAAALELVEAAARSVAARRLETLRIGLSGTPGVGKSTFIEAFGMDRIAEGHRVAVLAVDPSSARSGGSILGDKTRMERLARQSAAFIRPSPSQAALGGVARRTREAIVLCEAAGFDLIFVETVGVGQSETMVADMTDIFVLLMAPAGGDELQGVKRGIMELADLIVVNKADGALREAALRTCADYGSALRLMRARPADPPGYPKALAASAATGEGLAEVWAAIREIADFRRAHSHFAARREAQRLRWFEDALREGLLARLAERAGNADAHLIEDLRAGRITPERAALRVLAALDDEAAAQTGAKA